MNALIQKWSAEYDLVVLDGPPVLPVIDSVLLSEHADLVLVITRFGRTSIKMCIRDRYYIRNRGFFLDLAILLHTVIFAVRGI